MPMIFKEYDLSKWNRKDIQVMVAKYFKKYFPNEMIRVSKQEAFLE
jgi:hypothetical protein